MARVNVFLKDDLLRTTDAETEQAGMSRSAFLQAALLEYVENRRRSREQAGEQRRMDEACKKMDALAAKLGAWDPAKAIRRFRGSRSNAVRDHHLLPRMRKRP